MIVDPVQLIDRLRQEKRETEWLEFKLNRFEEHEVGQYVSGLANSAILADKDRAYLVFGIEDGTHNAVGTNIVLKDKKVGNQIFEQWLSSMLHPQINLDFLSFEYKNVRIEMIVIEPGYISPVRFKNEAYVRVDSVQKLLRDFPQRERAIWAITSRFCFEEAVAVTHLTADEIYERFFCEKLFSGLNGKKATDGAVIDQLVMEGLAIDDQQGGFDITNLLVITAARDMRRYENLKLKPARVIAYKDADKLSGKDDVSGQHGYALAFPRMLRFIMDKIPHKEIIEHGIRSTKYALPEKAVRELVANALIHQDLTISGAGPRVEIFQDRMKITNPGIPLISPDRFIDAPPRSRNEKLAGLMRRLGLCESRGSGIDRALDAIEAEALPPPFFQVVEGHTVVTLYTQKSFAAMTRDERLRACYQHASLRFEAGQTMSNQSLRTRLGLTDRQYPQVSNVIREALDTKLIFPLDQDQGNRNARYIPWWAK